MKSGWSVCGVLFAIGALAVGCGDGGSGSSGNGGHGGSSMTPGGSGGTGTGGASTGGTSTGGTGGSTPVDLCAGLVQDKDPHPMTELAKPAVGQAVTDAEFGTTIRRITGVSAGGGNDPVVKPMYSTISAWNADESRLLLFSVAEGAHLLYDGKTYALLGPLDISPADIEQVYWHTTDPDVLFYVDGKDFIRYHVAAATKEVLTTFNFCAGSVSAGSDPLFTSWDSKRIGLGCDDQVFLYDIAQNKVLAQKTIAGNPAQAAPSGDLAYLSDTGEVTDAALNVVRTLDLTEPWGHA